MIFYLQPYKNEEAIFKDPNNDIFEKFNNNE